MKFIIQGMVWSYFQFRKRGARGSRSAFPIGAIVLLLLMALWQVFEQVLDVQLRWQVSGTLCGACALLMSFWLGAQYDKPVTNARWTKLFDAVGEKRLLYGAVCFYAGGLLVVGTIAIVVLVMSR